MHFLIQFSFLDADIFNCLYTLIYSYAQEQLYNYNVLKFCIVCIRVSTSGKGAGAERNVFDCACLQYVLVGGRNT